MTCTVTCLFTLAFPLFEIAHTSTQPDIHLQGKFQTKKAFGKFVFSQLKFNIESLYWKFIET